MSVLKSEQFKKTALGFGKWLLTARLLRRNKGSEYLSDKVAEERQNTQMLMGALMEFGRASRIPYDEIMGFLRDHNVDVNVAPDFQWEQKCLPGPRMVLEVVVVEEELG